jgi:hypothetical protein
VLCLQPIIKPSFYLTTIGRHFLFVPSSYYRSHSLTAAHTSGGLAAGNDKRQLSGKMWMQSYRIGALASVSHLCSYIISLQFLYFKFLFLFLSSNLLFLRLCSGSVQLSYHLRLDLLSTPFLSTLRPISSANRKSYSCITVYTAVQMSHCIILHFVPLNSYWLHETCLKYKLYEYLCVLCESEIKPNYFPIQYLTL